jgi:hypothetical protein
MDLNAEEVFAPRRSEHSLGEFAHLMGVAGTAEIGGLGARFG